MSYGFPVISADSHITEHPDTYSAHIDSKWKDKAPRMVNAGVKGDLFIIDGMDRPIAMASSPRRVNHRKKLPKPA